MKRKIFSTLLAMVMAFSLVGGIAVQSNTVSAKSISFGGEYTKKFKEGNRILKMKQYSSPKGKKVGKFSLMELGYNDFTGNYNLWESVDGVLTKVGKNKYRCKKGNVTFTFTVYKKKVVVKQNKKGSLSTNFKGTYK